MNRLLKQGISWLDHTSDRVVRGLVVGTVGMLLAWALIFIWHQVEFLIGTWDQSSPITVKPVGEPPVVKAGQTAVLRVEVEYDRERVACSQTARRVVVDSAEIAYYLTSDAIAKDARAAIVESSWYEGITHEVPFVVPVNINPGAAFYEARLLLVCNEHQRKKPIPYRWRAPFIVVK